MNNFDAYMKFAAQLVLHFGMSWERESRRIEAGFEYLKHIPASVFSHMVHLAVRTWDTWPRNWVKGITELYAALPTEAKPREYDPVEDFNFPVGLMQDALQVLDREGETAFSRYADNVRMPANDRQRVLFKHRVYRDRDLSLEARKLTQSIGGPASSR